MTTARANGVSGPRRMRARLGADLRLARRQVRRTPGSSLLVMLLVLLPVAAMVGGAVFWQSHVATPEQNARLMLGESQARFEIVGGYDPSRTQDVDKIWSWRAGHAADGSPLCPELPPPESPAGFVPEGTTLVRIDVDGRVRVSTGDASGMVPAAAGDVGNPVVAGRYVDQRGTAARGAGEAMATTGLLTRFGVSIGDTLEVGEGEDAITVTVTGTIRQADLDDDTAMIFLTADGASLIEGTPVWFSPDWQPDAAEFAQLSIDGFAVFARDLALDPPPASRSVGREADAQTWAMLSIGTIVAAFCGYLVVLLAGAAFSVAARRQQRSLAVATSVGASQADIFRIVLLQGTVLGVVGGLLGVAVGIGLAALAIAVTNRGVVGGFWGVWGFNVPWGILGGILLFAVVVGTISALAPARLATRGDVLGALRGARRPPRLEHRRPMWGLVLSTVGLAATVVSAFVLLAFNQADDPGYSSLGRLLAQWGVALGPLAFQVGVVLAGQWILALIARILGRFGTAPRLAARDSASNPSRVVPAFAAIAASVFLASFALSAVAITGASSERAYWASGPIGSATISLYADDADTAALVPMAERLFVPSDPESVVVVGAPVQPAWDAETQAYVDPETPIYGVAGQNANCAGCISATELMYGQFVVVAPEDVSSLFETPVPAAALDAFRRGEALVTDPEAVSAEGDFEITAWTAASQDAYWTARNALMSTGEAGLTEEDADEALPDPDASWSVPAEFVDRQKQSQFAIILSPQTAATLGIEVAPQQVVGLYDGLQPAAVYDGLTADAEEASTATTSFGVQIEYGRAPDDPWLWAIAGVTMVLVIGAAAVSLGLARVERRPDDATLTAVGASRGLRRRVNAWQAVIIVGIGTLLGAVAGQIPMWGLATSSDTLRYWSDAPWGWLIVLTVGLPVVVAAASWLIPPRRPDLTRRTAIA